MPKETYRRVRIPTIDDNVVLDQLVLFEKRLNKRLKAMEQEILDLRSLVQTSNIQQPLYMDGNPTKSNAHVSTLMRKIPTVVPADSVNSNETMVAEIEKGDDDNKWEDSDSQREEAQLENRDYTLDETLRTVTDVVREWSKGSASGMPPLKEQVKGPYQNGWFTTITQRELFYERETIYSEVAFIAQERKINEEEAAAALEAHRVKEGYSLKTLARLIKSHQRRRDREQIDQTPYI